MRWCMTYTWFGSVQWPLIHLHSVWIWKNRESNVPLAFLRSQTNLFENPHPIYDQRIKWHEIFAKSAVSFFCNETVPKMKFIPVATGKLIEIFARVCLQVHALEQIWCSSGTFGRRTNMFRRFVTVEVRTYEKDESTEESQQTNRKGKSKALIFICKPFRSIPSKILRYYENSTTIVKPIQSMNKPRWTRFDWIFMVILHLGGGNSTCI